MAKRFLKYDTENPVGVDSEGVLTGGGSTGSGGGFDAILSIRPNIGECALVHGDYNKLIEKYNKQEPILAIMMFDHMCDIIGPYGESLGFHFPEKIEQPGDIGFDGVHEDALLFRNDRNGDYVFLNPNNTVLYFKVD